MSAQMSLKQLNGFIADNVQRIGALRREMDEIQLGFNAKYVEWKAEHDAALERLVEAVVARMDEVGPDLRARIEERVVEEQRQIEARRQELRQTLIPQAQQQADATLREGRSIIELLRDENPRLDRREEQLKTRRQDLEAALAQLNQQVRRLSGCLGAVINFFKINKLDRERQRVIGQLEQVQQDLRDVRQEWEEVRQGMQAEEAELQARWQELTRRVTRLQGELDYLDDAANRQALALKRAARHVIDDLKQPLPCPAADLKADLDAMVALNVQTDDYEQGLGSVSELMALLDGMREGLERFQASVEGLIEEQRMHSAYLPTLDVALPDDVVDFHAQWDDLADQVRDEGRLCDHPTEFAAIVRPVTDNQLNEAAIKAMFEEMGQALTAATSRWG